MGEFELIEQIFASTAQPEKAKPDVVLGIGDDCALLKPVPDMLMTISTDMLVEGRHFLSTISPERLGHKALAVNLSDLAAMGATPKAFTLSLALPQADEAWCSRFAKGISALAHEHDCQLIGGDTTRGPLCTISITVFGDIPSGQALLRSSAQVGDDIYISHPVQSGIGDARLVLEALRGQPHLVGEYFDLALERMECPQPRVALGQALRGVAHAAIDLSDGLLGDLEHILKASGVGARVEVDNIPRSTLMHQQTVELQRLCTLAGGDDYELIFTATPHQRAKVLAAAYQADIAVTVIGKVESNKGIRLLDARGGFVANDFSSFDHFKEKSST